MMRLISWLQNIRIRSLRSRRVRKPLKRRISCTVPAQVDVLEERTLLSGTALQPWQQLKWSEPVVGAGPGKGMSPEVVIYSAETGEEKFRFEAYGHAFEGGVRVAIGDVNGDAIPDIITAPGAGGGPKVRVFDGSTGTMIKEILAYDQSYTGGVFVAAGDVDGDGYDEVITGPGSGHTPTVKVFDCDQDGIAAYTERASFLAYGVGFTAGVFVAGGDVTGDGRVDVIVGPGPGGGPNVRVYNALNLTDQAYLHQIAAYESGFYGGVFVASGDVNGDGYDDVITGPGNGRAPTVRVFDGTTRAMIVDHDAYSAQLTSGVRVASTDMNSDGTDEIVTGPGKNWASLVKIFNYVGTSELSQAAGFYSHEGFTGGVLVGGNATRDVVLATVGEGQVFSLDLTNVFTNLGGTITEWTVDWGDGSPLEILSGSATSATHTYSSGYGEYIVRRIATVDGAYQTHADPVLLSALAPENVGDFDGDGATDVARRHASGKWELRLNRGTYFLPLLGGTWNSTADWAQSFVGDLNGDGRDDIAGYDPSSGTWQFALSTGDGFEVTQSWSDPGMQGGLIDFVLADFTGDRRDDLAARSSTTGQWQIRVSTGRTFEAAADWGDPWLTSVTWVDVLAGDFDGDGRSDLAGRDAATGQWQLSSSTGTDFFARSWGTWSAQVNWEDLRVGDFDGNGHADLAGRNPTSGTWQVSLSGSADPTVSSWGSAVALTALSAIDVNRDGKDDLVGQESNGVWRVYLSNGSGFSSQVWAADGDGGTVPWFIPLSWHDVQVVDHFHRLDEALDAFEFVRNNVHFQPYFGLMKGAAATEETREGNSWDQSLLLVEKLERAGVGTKFVEGRADVPASAAMDWLGARAEAGAERILYHAGLGVKELANGHLEFDHTWVRAWLPGPEGLAWRDLDPSWKFQDRQPGVPGIRFNVPFDETGYLSQVYKRLPFEHHENQVADWLVANTEGVSLADVPYTGPIIAQTFDVVPEALGFKVAKIVAERASYAEIPDTKKHRIRITMRRKSDQTAIWQAAQTLAVPDVALKRITITYADLGGGQVRPQLRLDGSVVYEDGQIARNDKAQLVLESLDPYSPSSSQAYAHKAGQYLAIGLGAMQYSNDHLVRLREQVNDATLNVWSSKPASFTNPQQGDRLIGATLSLAIAWYFQNLEQQARIIDGLQFVKTMPRRVASGVAMSEPTVTYHADAAGEAVLQIPVVPDDLFVDVKNGQFFGQPLGGGDWFSDARWTLVGHNASALEHAVIEELTNAFGVSTVKGLQLANENGIPVYTFVPGTSEAEIRAALNLSNADEASIVAKVADGYTVRVHRDPLSDANVSASIPHWSGSVYFAKRYVNGAASYSWTINKDGETLDGGVTAAPPSEPDPIPKSNFSEWLSWAGDPVTTSNGNMFRDDVDFALPSAGLPLTFARRYNSQSQSSRGFGVGWAFTYSDFLQFKDTNGDGHVDFVWTTGQGHEHTFLSNGAGGFTVPQTLHGTLTINGGLYRYREKDGLVHEFEKVDSTWAWLRTVRDRNGNAIQITNSVMGPVTAIDDITDPLNPARKLTFDYAPDGSTVTVEDFTGRVWTYSFATLADGKRYLVEAASPSDSQTEQVVTRYEYIDDGGPLQGLMNKIIEPDGGTHTYSYYINRRAFKVTDEEGHQTSFTYNLYRNQTDFLDELGRTTEYVYNVNGLLGRQVHPDRSRIRHAWEDFLMTSGEDVFGRLELYAYDSGGKGNLTQLTERDGLVTTFTYNPTFNLVESITRGAGTGLARTTTYSYDSNGNAEQMTDAQGNVTTMTYYANGLLHQRTAPKGTLTGTVGDYTTTFEYNALGLITRQILPDLDGAGGEDPPEITYTYDAAHGGIFLKTATDPTGVTTTYHFDVLGRKRSEALPDPDGAGELTELTTLYEYDVRGNLVVITDAAGNTTRHAYDLKRNLIETRRADLSHVRHEYDGAKNRIATTDSLDRTTRFVFDRRNRVIQVIYPDRSSTHTRYDGDGRPVEAADANGNSTAFHYDRMGRLLASTDALQNAATNTYDAVGNVIVRTDRRGEETRFTYDKLNRVTQVRRPQKDAGGTTIGFYEIRTIDYDANGNVSKETRYELTGLSLAQIPPDPRTLDATRHRTYETRYDEHDRPVEWVNPATAQNTRSVTYDAAGRVTSRTDELQRTTHVTYDGAGRLSTETRPDPDGAGTGQPSPVTTYVYDANGNVLSVTETISATENRVTTYGYDALNRRVQTVDAEGFVHQSLFDAVGQLAATIDPLGRSAIFTRDERGRVVKVTSADPDLAGTQLRPVTRTTYDAVGNVLSATDALGRTTDYEYDALNRLVREFLPGEGDDEDTLRFDFGTSSSPVATGYTRVKNTTEYSGAAGYGWTASVGAVDRTGQPDPLKRDFNYSPDATFIVDLEEGAYRATVIMGDQVTPKDAMGVSLEGVLVESVTPSVGEYFTGTYPVAVADGQLTLRLHDLGGINENAVINGLVIEPVTAIEYSYDTEGNLISRTDQLGRTSVWEYDGLGRMVHETLPDPDGDPGTGNPAPETFWTYNSLGELTKVLDHLGRGTDYQYDALSRRIKEILPDPDEPGTGQDRPETVWTFDAVGNVRTVQDAEQNTTTFVYDNLDRTIGETNQRGHTRAFEYDLLGRRTVSTDRNGRVREFSYDKLDRLTEERWLDGVNVVETVSFVYDGSGQLLSASNGDGSYSYTYDRLGRTITEDNLGTPSTPNVVLTHAYDPVGNRTSLAATAGGTADFTNTYQYDALSRMTRVEQSGTGVAQKRVDLAYNVVDQFTAITRYADLAGTQLVATSSYGYDQAHRITGLAHAKGSTTFADYAWTYDDAERIASFTSPDGSSAYSYDRLDQITTADHSYQTDESYGYDGTGNRTNTGYQTGTNNLVLSDGTHDYAWDNEGNLTRKTTSATGEYVEYEWDHRNNLVRAEFRTSTGTLTKVVEQDYDPFGRRIGKRVDETGGGSFERAERFVYDGGDVVLRYDESGSLESRYLHGPAVDQFFADEDALGDVLWGLADNQQTVRDLAEYDAATDTTSVVNHIEYDSFGDVTAQSNAAKQTLSGYTGQDHDADLGMVWYAADGDGRWYLPEIGRFASEDRDGLSADVNLTRYVGNSPVNYTDPTGRNLDSPQEHVFDALRQEILQGSSPSTAPIEPDWSSKAFIPDNMMRCAVCHGDPQGNFINVAGNANLLSEASWVQQEALKLLAGEPNSAVIVTTPDILVNPIPEFGQHLGAGFVPILGEAQDVMVMADPAAPLWQKAIAGVSLGLNAVTGGFLPNAGGFLRGGDELTGALYEVGKAGRLRDTAVDSFTRVHHAPQTAEAAKLVGDHQEAAKLLTGKRFGPANREPAIRVSISEHDAISAAQRSRTATASARHLLADEIRLLRKHTNAPNSAFKNLIELNRKLHPSDYLPLQRIAP